MNTVNQIDEKYKQSYEKSIKYLGDKWQLLSWTDTRGYSSYDMLEVLLNTTDDKIYFMIKFAYDGWDLKPFGKIIECNEIQYIGYAIHIIKYTDFDMDKNEHEDYGSVFYCLIEQYEFIEIVNSLDKLFDKVILPYPILNLIVSYELASSIDEIKNDPVISII